MSAMSHDVSYGYRYLEIQKFGHSSRAVFLKVSHETGAQYKLNSQYIYAYFTNPIEPMTNDEMYRPVVRDTHRWCFVVSNCVGVLQPVITRE